VEFDGKEISAEGSAGRAILVALSVHCSADVMDLSNLHNE